MTQRSPNAKMELFKERSRELFGDDFTSIIVEAFELDGLIHHPNCFRRRRGNLAVLEPNYKALDINLSENLDKLCVSCFNTLTSILPNVSKAFVANTFIERCDKIQGVIERMEHPAALTKASEFGSIVGEEWAYCSSMFRGGMKQLLDHYPKTMDDFEAAKKAYTKRLLANDQEVFKKLLGGLIKFPRGAQTLRGKSVVVINTGSASTHESIITNFMRNASYGVTEVGVLRAFITSDYLALAVDMAQTVELDDDLDPQTLRTALVLCDGRLSDFKDRLHSAQSL